MVSIRTSGARDDKAHSTGAAGARASHPQQPSLIELLSVESWRRFVLETLLLVAAATAFQLMVYGSTVVPAGAFHPYWVPVLLIACQHGVMAGMFATVVCCVGYFGFGIPSYLVSEDFHVNAAAIAAQPAAWLAATLVLGGLRTLHMHRQTELAERLKMAEHRTEDFADALERVTEEIRSLEARIAAQLADAATVSHTLANLDLTSRRRAVASFCDLLRFCGGASTFTLYLIEGREAPVALAVVDDVVCPVEPFAPLDAAALQAALTRAASRLPMGQDPASGSQEAHVSILALDEPGAQPLGLIVCSAFRTNEDVGHARQRLDELCRALAKILSMCPPAQAGGYVRDRLQTERLQVVREAVR